MLRRAWQNSQVVAPRVQALVVPAVTRHRAFSSESDAERRNAERASDQTDILIVGGGPAGAAPSRLSALSSHTRSPGLSAAIRAKQVAKQAGKDIKVTVLEKGAEIGAYFFVVFSTYRSDMIHRRAHIERCCTRAPRFE